ncbi:hypothetical protein F4604DRAFT_1913578 [Suillus subluteus]|nr:hypothetical protein F4604DRAFT_1913578 [Suillus subluteus]
MLSEQPDEQHNTSGPVTPPEYDYDIPEDIDYEFPPRAREAEYEPVEAPQSKWARVEEVADEEQPERFANVFPHPAADVLGAGQTAFEEIREDQINMGLEANPWAPFCDEEEWGLAEWLAKRVNQKAIDEFLKLAIKLDKLPKGPGWMCDIMTSTGDRVDRSQEFLTERHELWRWDPVECVHELVGNPAFKEYLAYLPEKVYADPEGKTQVYDEMWTGDWWWNMQERLPPGAVVAPVILTSDKTNLTRFCGDKAAWPIYLTIWNIKKDIHRQPSKHHILQITPSSALLHVAKKITALVVLWEPNNEETMSTYLSAMSLRSEQLSNDIKMVKTLTFLTITVCVRFIIYILHQLHKGVFKDHIISWCATIMSDAEFDAHFQAMSEFHGLRHFKRGISNVSQWTCTEHKEMQHVVLGVIAGAVEPRVFQAARAILDFIYYAQYHARTDTTLMRMQEALNVFHANKAIFIELGLREHFNIPKVHSIADDFNSESPERLHIDYAKDAYQASSKVDYIAQMTHWLKLQEAVFQHGVYLDWVASQSRDPLTDSDLDVLEEEDEEEELADSDSMAHTPDVLLSQFTPSGLLKSHGYRVTKTCPFLNISMSRLQTDFGAIDFIPALQTFLARHFPHSSISASEYDRFNVFKSVLLLLPRQNHISDVKRLNRIRAHPAIPNRNRRKPPSPAHFDVAFIVEDRQLWESGTGFDGLRLAQIRAIFKLPSQYSEFPHPLAYIKWFRPLREPEAATRLYRVAQSTRNQRKFAAVVSVQDLLQGGHLFPRFGSGKVDVSWINSDVLELADEFHVNPYINFYLFDTMERL